MISEQGISVDPDKVGFVKSWSLCKIVSKVQSFLGFTSLYRRITKEIAKTLHQVAQGSVHYQTMARTRVGYPPLKFGLQQLVFDKLKGFSSFTSFRRFANRKPFILQSDASVW